MASRMHAQVLVLASAQALFQTASVMVMTVGGLAGGMIASRPELATMPIAAMFLGTAVATFPASIRRLRELPDHVEVLPGAYSGSVCGRSLSGKPSSTIGFKKRYNKAFRIEDEYAFVAAMVADIPPPPSDAARIRAVNMGSAL